MVALSAVALTVACSGLGDRHGAEPADRAATVTALADAGGTSINPAVAPVGTARQGRVRAPDGTERSYRLYRPSTLTPGQPVPLLIALHGGLGWGEQFATASNFDGLAEANGFLVAYPNGTSIAGIGDHGVFNAGGCCGRVSDAAADDGAGVDDVGFVAAVIDDVAAAEAVDPARIYATGHSNGAMMADRLACELADRIAAVAVQSGALFVDRCRPARAVSVLAIHGAADENVPLAGGQGDRSLADVEFPVDRDGVARLAAADGCAATTVVHADPANPDVSIETWDGCPDSIAVTFITVAGAGHAWMGSAGGPLASLRGAVPYEQFDSSAAVWSFLSAHHR